MRSASSRASPPRANAIEFRMDLAERPIPAARLAGLDSRAAILTWRSLAEGGEFSGSAEEYRRLVEEAYASGATVDVEHDRGLLADPSVLPDRAARPRVAPLAVLAAADWDGRVAAMKATGARVAKLVAGTADLAASLRVADLQRSRPGDGVAIFPMGPASAPGRVLSALNGAAAVYGPVGRDTAAGQLPLARPDRRLRGGPSASDRGALRRRRRDDRALALAAPAQRPLPGARPAVPLPAAPDRRLRSREAARDRRTIRPSAASR